MRNWAKVRGSSKRVRHVKTVASFKLGTGTMDFIDQQGFRISPHSLNFPAKGIWHGKETKFWGHQKERDRDVDSGILDLSPFDQILITAIHVCLFTLFKKAAGAPCPTVVNHRCAITG